MKKKEKQKEEKNENINDEKMKLIKKEKEKIKKNTENNKPKIIKKIKSTEEPRTINNDKKNYNSHSDNNKNTIIREKQIKEPTLVNQKNKEIIQPLQELQKVNRTNNPISINIPSNNNSETVSRLTIPSKEGNIANTNINIIIRPSYSESNQKSSKDLDTNLLSQINDKLTALLLSNNNQPKSESLQNNLLNILSNLTTNKLSNVVNIPNNPSNASISYYPSYNPSITQSFPSTAQQSPLNNQQPPLYNQPSLTNNNQIPSNPKYSKYHKILLKLQNQVNSIQSTISQSKQPQQSITTNPPKEIIIQPLIERQPINQIIQPIQPVVPIRSLRPSPPEYTYYKIYNRN